MRTPVSPLPNIIDPAPAKKKSRNSIIETKDFKLNQEKEICQEIGVKLKNLRISGGYSSYETFAVDHDLSRMHYWRIEKGLTNLTIRSLVRILNIHKISAADFFRL